MAVNSVVIFSCIVLFLKCVNSMQDCSDFEVIDLFKLKKNETYYVNDTNWYFSKYEVSRKKILENIKKDISKKPFKYLDLIAYPIPAHIHRGYIQNCSIKDDSIGLVHTGFCLNISKEDIMAADWMKFEFSKGEDKDEITIKNSRKNCTDNQKHFVTLCFCSNILRPLDRTPVTLLEVESNKSYAKFRFRLPYWRKHKEKEDLCVFEPFIYSTTDKIYVKLENCTSQLNLTIFGHKNGAKITIQTYENITLNERTIVLPVNDSLGDFFSGVVNILEDPSKLNLTSLTNVSDGTESTTDSQSSSQSYLLLYLIPFIFCLVLTIAFLILRPEIKFMWKKITKRTDNTKPSIKVLYCKCSDHAVYAKQLKTLLHFVEKYCNVNIEDFSEKEYDDTEALLHRRHQGIDYVILVPMPELSTSNPENESGVQKKEEELKIARELEEEFQSTKEKKRIILQIPFEGILSEKNYGFPATHFKLMDEFIPFIQHLHRKYSSERRDFLTVDKIMDIKQKLEDNHLTDGGFEFLTNQFTDESNLQNNKVNNTNFLNLNDLSL